MNNGGQSCLGEIALTSNGGLDFVLEPQTKEERAWCRLAAIGIEAYFYPQTKIFPLKNTLIIEALLSVHPQNRICWIGNDECALLDAFLRKYCHRDERGAFFLHRGAVDVCEINNSFCFSFRLMG